MLNELAAFIRRYELLEPGDSVVCAVSGGADSMAMLFAMYLLREKLQLQLSAAHFNHGLRGVESDAEEAFVREFCEGYGIRLYCGKGQVTAGKKGLEAAAREARYAFFETLPGKLATAHTADDNAETVVMHLVRGTGLKGLGGIAPVRGKLIRPMLSVTRQQVLAFLQEYSIPYKNDSSNDTDAFLRNRLRHHVMPLLREENPRLAENLSAMALQLRQDEAALSQLAGEEMSVEQLRSMPEAVRNRALSRFLESNGVKEPERSHIALAAELVNSQNPSARANFPGGVSLCRRYDRLTVYKAQPLWEPVTLSVPGTVELHGYRITAAPATELCRQRNCFTVCTQGPILLRQRASGDSMRLAGGSKSLKKLFIDEKIPASDRSQIPVLADTAGVLGVCGIGANLDRLGADGVRITIEYL